jgi:hypothetical protein
MRRFISQIWLKKMYYFDNISSWNFLLPMYQDFEVISILALPTEPFWQTHYILVQSSNFDSFSLRPNQNFIIKEFISLHKDLGSWNTLMV